MKIALYISDLNRGGAQRVIVNLANHLDDIGNEVLIITTIDKETSYHINKGVRVTTLNYDYYERKKEPKIERVLGIGKHLIRLKNILRKFKTEVVITFLTFEINCILSIKPFIKSKLIISVRNDPKMIYRTDYQIKRANLMFRLADGIVFQTKEAQSFFSSKLFSKSTIIKNPINNDFIVDRYTGERDKTIVSVGKFTEQKNHILLIDAFSKIADEIPDFNLVIYGDGILRDEYIKKSINIILKKRIYLPGIKDNIKDYIYDATLFVLSSNYEGLSNALLEAMSLGLPVISTDCPCGGSREIINHDVNGVLVQVNDVDEMGKAIRRLVYNESKLTKLSKKAVNVQKTLNPEVINHKWVDFIYEI